MRKSTDELTVGDWVVLESIILSRFCGKPWKVTKISGSRVYLQAYTIDPISNAIEVSEQKYVARKSIKFAFTSECAANAVWEKSRELSELYEATIRQAKNEHMARVLEFIAKL